MRLTTIEYVLVALIVTVFVCVISRDSTSPNVAKSKTPSLTSGVEIPPTELKTEMSLEEFRLAYNEIATDRNVLSLQIKDFEIGNGEHRDIFSYSFYKGFNLIGKIDDETGYVKNVSVAHKFVLSGEDRQKEAQVIGLVFLMVVQTLSPELTSVERAKILETFAESPKRYVKFDTEKIKYSQAFFDDNGTVLLSADVK